MNAEVLAQRIADGQAIDWDELDSTDPVVSGLHKISRFLQNLSSEAVTRPAEVSRHGEWGNLLLIEPIGRGSFGEVYRALDPVLQRDVALKVIKDPDSCLLDPDDFITEAQNLAHIRHRNVLAVYGAAYHDNEVGFWSELLLGQTLEKALGSEQRFSWEESLQIMRDLTHALIAVHEAGLVHGDIKAGNVMLEPERGAVLLDFGAGIHSDNRRPLGPAQGTPLAMAPELFDGEACSHSSDVYALGALFYRLIAGKYPFEAASLEQLQPLVKSGPTIDRNVFPGVPRAFRVLLRQMLAQDPKQRPGAETVLEQIDWLISMPERRVRRIAMGTIAALLLGVAIASTVGYWFSNRAQHQMELARAETQAVNGFLTNMLASASPVREGKDVRVTEVLSQAEASLNFGEELPPEVRNDVKLTLASTYLGLRVLDEAERILNEILVDPERTLSPATEWKARDLLALVYSEQRDWGKAVEMARQSLRLAETIERDSDMLLDSEITLARAHLQHADRAQAVVRLEQAIAKHPDASEDGIGRAYLAAGNIHEEIGQFETALERYQKAAEYFYSVNGEQNANTISAYSAIASVFGQQGKGEEAARLLREQIEIATDFLGPDHKKTWTMRMNLGAVLADYGDFAGALEVQEGVYQTNLRVIGEDGLESILTRGNIATLLVESDRTGEAEQIYRDNIDRLLAHHPEEHNYRLIQEFNLAELLNTLGRYSESRERAVVALEQARLHLGEVSIVGLELYESIARSNLGLGDAALAAEQLGVSAQTKTEHLGATHPLTLNAVLRQGDAFLAMGNTEEARALYLQALEGRTEVFGSDHSASKEVETRLSGL